MPDHVMIYPNHAAGSPCGADIGARLSSTIGYERKFNKFLQFADVKSLPITRSKPRRRCRTIIR
jgi:hydroxyacylglutathione hydrolase